MPEEKDYSPLHVHTEFSLLDGAIKLKDYFEFAKKEGWKSIAITDHGNIFGAVKFFQLAKKYNIKPILGAEMYFTPDVNTKVNAEKKYNHMTILVQNEIGYKNLCRLFSFAYKKGFYFKPRIDFESLKANNQGLVVLSGCLGGYIPGQFERNNPEEAKRATEWFIDVFGPERFFIEVMPEDTPEQKIANEKLFALASEYGLKTAATPDSHYLYPEHHQAHETMLSVGTKNLLTDEKRFTFGDFKGHLKTTQEMLSAFPSNPEAVWNTGEIAKTCNFEFTFGKLFFPKFEIPEQQTEESFFLESCRQGLQDLFDRKLIDQNLKEQYFQRLKIETDLICKMGFVGYFLVVSDFIKWAKKNGIPVGPGRGSAAGSLVAWALQITNIDPIKYNLLFERFLNPERITMPDVDIDFDIQGRERVIEYVKEKYGYDAVCQIITFGTMMAKGVIKDVARTWGFSFADSQAITDLIPDQLKITLDQAVEQEPQLAQMIKSNEKIKKLFETCKILEGLTRHASKHAAGVVISPEPLENVLPLYIPSKSNELVTQYAMTELEAVGFLKMDFLGLKNLTVIKRTVDAVKKNYGTTIDLDALPLDDKATFDNISQGNTAGVFQFEGSGVTEIMVKLKPNKFEDLIAVNALYRPGPLGSGMVDDFIAGRHGTKEPSYMFEELRPVLEETYGVIVYQEQVMKIASVIAGYSLGSADILRRAMGKKKAEVMAEQKEKFVKGAAEKNFDKLKAGKLFDLMAYFAGYGFNKSHSAAYALIAYQTAYLKTHYPNEFTAATLTFETNDPDKLQEYLVKASESGIKIIMPDINKSEIEFYGNKDGILFGLKGIKNLGATCLEKIVQERTEKGPFKSLYDFCFRIGSRHANKRVVESLIYSGAMDNLSGNRAQKINKLESIIAQAQTNKEAESRGQTGIFALKKSSFDSNLQEIEFENIKDFSDEKKLEKEKEVVGFYLSSHPLDPYKKIAKWIGCEDLSKKYDNSINDKIVLSIGVLENLKTITTKKGDRMAFAQLRTQTGSCEIVIFNKTFLKTEEILEIGKIFIVTGQAESSGNKLKIKARTIKDIDSFINQKNFEIRIKLDSDFNQSQISHFAQSLTQGEDELSILVSENNKVIKIKPSKKYNLDLKTLETIDSNNFIEIQIKL